ncbi:hypothetical protein [Falsiroseomonas oryziterrae]|uniref:hypothetical protein n=1 Tax=Falsiroseomonas oryziterrae TaxID=2911368 RepID=UPI001F34E566|nr:hypothetical protein [Roseomonas sp. NPKOSM-4]
MSAPSRRALLALPLLLSPAIGRAGPTVIPPFQEWVGRTASLRGDAGTARLLLAADGGGLLSVRLFVFCRALPVRAWRIEEDGMAMRYSRVSALDSRRIIEGEAHILPAERQLLWIEAARCS